MHCVLWRKDPPVSSQWPQSPTFPDCQLGAAHDDDKLQQSEPLHILPEYLEQRIDLHSQPSEIIIVSRQKKLFLV